MHFLFRAMANVQVNRPVERSRGCMLETLLMQALDSDSQPEMGQCESAQMLDHRTSSHRRHSSLAVEVVES